MLWMTFMDLWPAGHVAFVPSLPTVKSPGPKKPPAGHGILVERETPASSACRIASREL